MLVIPLFVQSQAATSLLLKGRILINHGCVKPDCDISNVHTYRLAPTQLQTAQREFQQELQNRNGPQSS